MAQPKIVLQAGHINTQNNSIVSLRTSTGAPGEQELTKRITDRLANTLRAKGFYVVQTDACANDDKTITTQDWQLFLAIHGDADLAGDNGGGFTDFPEPSTDAATVESQRIAKVLNDTYYPETKILYTNHSNANTRYYYMWKFLSAKTPCCLIELGQVQDPHDKVLLANTDLIVNAIARSLCKAFNLPYDIPIPPITQPDPQIIALQQQVKELQKALEQAKLDNIASLALATSNCKKKMDNFKSSLLKIINETI